MIFSHNRLFHFQLTGNILATGCYDGTTHLWGDDGKLLTSLAHHSAPITNVVWNKDGTSAATCSLDNTVVCFDAAGKLRQRCCQMHANQSSLAIALPLPASSHLRLTAPVEVLCLAFGQKQERRGNEPC